MVQDEEVAQDAVDDEDYEPGSPHGEDPMDGEDDLVPFINGRLEDEEQGEELPTDEVSGHSSEGSSPGHTTNAGAKQLKEGHAGAEKESSAKQLKEGHAGAEKDFSAEQLTEGHAGAEKEDSNAEQLSEGHAGAESQNSVAKQSAKVSGHMTGNSAVLASMAEASVQPELIICSDDEEVPRRPIPTPARAVLREQHLSELKQKLLHLSLCMQFQHKHVCVCLRMFVCINHMSQGTVRRGTCVSMDNPCSAQEAAEGQRSSPASVVVVPLTMIPAAWSKHASGHS